MFVLIIRLIVLHCRNLQMKWLKEKGYGGAFIWTLDFDDFKGTNCGKGPYPLLNAINNELKREVGYLSLLLF